MKKLLKYFTLLLLVLIIGIGFYLYPKLPIINGYAAKMVCSCTFVANRSVDSAQKHELNFFPINLANASINYDEQSASSTFLGFVKRTAYYNPQTGCALVDDENAQEYRNISFQTDNRYSQIDSLEWPYSNRVSTLLDSNINITAIKVAVNDHFSEDNDLPIGENRNTRAVVVIHKGKLIYEQYAPGFTENTRLLGWSMTKSVVNALVGILVQKKKININDPVPIPEWKNDDRKNITWNHLLQMNSALNWNEDYTKKSPATSMLYLSNSMYDFAIQEKLEAKIGKHWEYSSGTTNIITGLLKKMLKEEYLSFPYNDLLSKIGANSFLIETDGSGGFVGSSYGWATARDWGKFGLLFLNDGLWNGDQILPKGWAKYSGTSTSESKGVYGAHFWTKNSGEKLDVKNDVYMAQGFQEQRIFIFPSQDLVVVRMGLTQGGGFAGFNDMLKIIQTSI